MHLNFNPGAVSKYDLASDSLHDIYLLLTFYIIMYLHSAELNAVAVTENVNTLLLV